MCGGVIEILSAFVSKCACVYQSVCMLLFLMFERERGSPYLLLLKNMFVWFLLKY